MARPNSEHWWWEARKAYYATVHGVRHRLGTTERDSKRVLKKLLREEPKPVASGSVLEVVDRFLDFIAKKAEQRGAPRTFEWYQRHLQSFMDSIGNLSIAELKTDHIESWLDSKEWSDSTKHGAWRAINRCFRWAARPGRRLIIVNPATDVEKPSPGRRENPLTEEHYRAIIDGTRDEPFKDLLTVAWECGPRAQELFRMRVRHVELDEARIMFPRDEAKGKKRPRYVYLTQVALQIVKRCMAGKERDDSLFLNTGRGRQDRIADRKPRPWNMYSTNCRFLRWKKKLGVKYCMTDVRHAWQTRLLKAGVDPITVATLAGHVDKSMLANIYSHLDQDPEYLRESLTRGVGASDGTPKGEKPSAA